MSAAIAGDSATMADTPTTIAFKIRLIFIFVSFRLVLTAGKSTVQI
jgi:hypothetical protein